MSNRIYIAGWGDSSPHFGNVPSETENFFHLIENGSRVSYGKESSGCSTWGSACIKHYFLHFIKEGEFRTPAIFNSQEEVEKFLNEVDCDFPSWWVDLDKEEFKEYNRKKVLEKLTQY